MTYKRKAIALKYDDAQDYAPKVTAKGTGLTADNMMKKAIENNIPIQEDPSLTELLAELNINEKIPEELYLAVAEVFAFVYRLDQAQHTHKR